MSRNCNLYQRPWHQLLISLIAVLLWLAPLPGLAQESKQVEVAAAEQARETEAFNLGTEAYIYGYPLVIMETIQR